MSRTYPRISYRKPEKKYKVGKRHIRQRVGLPCKGCGNRTTGQIEISRHWSEPDTKRIWIRICDDCIKRPESELVNLALANNENQDG